MDSSKGDDAADVPNARREVPAAREIGARLLEGRLVLCYSAGMKREWISKRLLDNSPLIRDLFRFEMAEEIDPVVVPKGARAQLGKFVAHDDQPFLFAAASLPKKERHLVTRDPRSTGTESCRRVKADYGVTICLASEFIADQDE